MPISMDKFVDIKSSTNTTRTATEKELIARIFTQSDYIPYGEVLEFERNEIDNIGEIFGFSSDEYKIAEKYFKFVNKYARSPRKISFARDFRSGFSSYVVATKESDPLTTFKSFVGASGIGVVYGDITRSKAPVTSTDFSSCNSLEDVATLVQGWIRTAFSGDDVLQSCTITYNGNTNTFKFESGEEDDTSITFEGGIAGYMKLTNSDNVVKSEGVAETEIQNVFKKSYELNNNFATFMFNSLVTAEETSELGSFLMEKYPSEFMFIVPVIEENKETIQEATANIDGISLELCGSTENNSGKYNFVMPMAITATTDYNKENGTVDYMFTEYNEMAVVVDDDDSYKENDNLKINYYGRTQQAGQKLAFYQNGVLQGNYQDQNIFVNEIWLKDALKTKYINYMMLTSNWTANLAGKAIGNSLAFEVIQRAKLNGTITTEKDISEEDKVYILNITNDDNAWRQIYQEGYYLMTAIVEKTEQNQKKKVFTFTLLYSKGDSIKKVEGTDILI